MRERHGEKYYQNKQKIMDCFLDVIRNEGYYHATINYISKKTDLSYGSITNIFNTKEDILLEVLKVYMEEYEKESNSNKDKLILFISNIVKQFKMMEHDYNLKSILLEQFTHHKTTAYLRDYIANILNTKIESTESCYFKAIAIVGIIREYINTELNIFLLFDRKIDNLIESILLICEYSRNEIEKIKIQIH